MEWDKSSASFLYMWIPTCHRPFIEETIFHWMILALLQKINWPQVYGFTSGVSILFYWLIYISNLMLIAHYFNYSSFIVSFVVMNYESFKFVFLLQYGFGYLEFVVFHMNLKLNFSISPRQTVGILIGTALNLQITLDNRDILGFHLATFLQFSVYKCFASLVTFIPRILSFWILL